MQACYNACMQRTESLSADETKRLLVLLNTLDPSTAAKRVGLYDVRTFIKAAFGQPVSTLTAQVLRTAFANGVA